jgi:hypothetical protein
MPSGGIDVPSWIQAASAVITVIVTGAVAWYAKRSADTADKALAAAVEAVNEGRKAGKAAQDSAAAAQESTRISSIHFEREWVPHVEVLEIVFASSPNCGFNVLNLGMKDAILRTLLVKIPGLDVPLPIQFPLNVVAPSGNAVIVPLVRWFNVIRLRLNQPPPIAQQFEVLLCVNFHATGADAQNTPWKEYRVRFAANVFASAEEIPLP